MANTRNNPDRNARVYAMDHAVSIVNNNSFKQPGLSAVDIATVIADYITNGPLESSDEE